MNAPSVWDDRPGGKGVALLARGSSAIWLLVFLSVVCLATAAAQNQNTLPASKANQSPASDAAMQELPAGVVARVELRGTAMGTASYVVTLIEQKPGAAVDREAIRRSIRRLYETRLFEFIDVVWEPAGTGQINLIFETTPRYFCGSLSVDGLPKDGPHPNEMINSSSLELGTHYSPQRIAQTLERMHRLLEENGYYQAQITYQEFPDSALQQMNVKFHVVLGNLTHVGRVALTGDPDVALDDIEYIADLRPGDKIRKGQIQRALQRLRKHFQKGGRLTAQVGITHSYDEANNTVNYSIEVRRGPEVLITAEGTKMTRSQLKRNIPVFQEGAVDEDLLNEGRRNLRDFLQTEGYFDAKVTVKEEREDSAVKIVYQVDRGASHRLIGIKIEGNKYFDSQTIRERLSLQPSSWTQPHGRFSQAILAVDVLAIKNLYVANGFPNVEVAGNIVDNYEGDPQRLFVDFRIVEGQQVLVRSLTITGNKAFPAELLQRNLYVVPGQPYSEMNVATDQDTLVNFYFNNGFPQVQFEAVAKPSETDPRRMDVVYKITEGGRVYVEQVVVSGLVNTRKSVVDRRFSIRDGDPLDQAKMVETQSRLYDLGIFSAVNMAVQNPGGEVDHKNLLYQIQEARRYTFQFGGGIEFSTGNQPGSNPQGNTGVSPTVSFNATRILFRGRDESLILKAQVGNLIKRVLLSFDQPHWFDLPKWHFTTTFLYDNTRDVNTFTTERLGGSFQLEQRVSRANRLFYAFSYRQDKVDPSSFPAGFSQDLLNIYAVPVRIGMPSVTFVRDTRDDPVDSTKGIFTTADIGVATGALGSEANFGRVLVQNTTYHRLGNKYVFARSTRIGVESPYSSSSVVPLPEHFFAGGSTSLRGFAVNQAGPRDQFSGFPVGGNAMFVNNLELRTAPASLPLLGQGFSFVVFHDMGNVFDTADDMWSNLLRFSQRNQQSCRSLTAPCDFSYMSQAVGVGVRYHTPIGPVRLDFGYNLNPAYFAVITGSTPQVDQVRHFNLFFSIGQTF
ncbi:MAG: outer membrane protein assembly factor BamA [Candidatus Korobacteraceae bacterium]